MFISRYVSTLPKGMPASYGHSNDMDMSGCSLLRQILQDERFSILLDRIQDVVHDSTHYQKGSLNMRTQKCFAIKVSHQFPSDLSLDFSLCHVIVQ